MSVSLLLTQIPVALVFFVPGVALMLGAYKIAQYNKKVREAGLRNIERQAEQSIKLKVAKVFLWRATAEAGRHDALGMILIGLGLIVMGFFVLLHPNGWYAAGRPS